MQLEFINWFSFVYTNHDNVPVSVQNSFYSIWSIAACFSKSFSCLCSTPAKLSHPSNPFLTKAFSFYCSSCAISTLPLPRMTLCVLLLPYTYTTLYLFKTFLTFQLLFVHCLSFFTFTVNVLKISKDKKYALY